MLTGFVGGSFVVTHVCVGGGEGEGGERGWEVAELVVTCEGGEKTRISRATAAFRSMLGADLN